MQYLLLSIDPNPRVEGIANGDAHLRKTSVSPRLFRFPWAPCEEHALGMTPGQRALLFREVNDRIYELLESADPDLPGEFLCECGDDCGQRVVLAPSAFVALRQSGEALRSPGCRDESLDVAAA
jgi:hypothetical protein